MKIKKSSRDLLLSVSIGDGYIDKSGGVKILHSLAQKEYLEWKHRLLKGAGYSVSEIKYKDNSGYPAYSFRVNGSNFGKHLRKVLYSSGKKNYYSGKLLNRLNELHLAIWYMDDGGLSQKKRNGVITANDLMLNTHTTKENNQVLIDYFSEVWGIKFTQVKNKGSYRLRCGTKQARKFLDLVRPYVSQLECMSHKLNIKPVGNFLPF